MHYYFFCQKFKSTTKTLTKNSPDFSSHVAKGSFVSVFAVGDDVKDEVQNEDAVVDPHRDENNEPGPSCALVKSKNL